MEVNRVPVFDTGTRMGTSLRRAGLVPRHGVPAKPPAANTAGGSFFGALDSACQSYFKALARAFPNEGLPQCLQQNPSSRSHLFQHLRQEPGPSRNPLQFLTSCICSKTPSRSAGRYCSCERYPTLGRCSVRRMSMHHRRTSACGSLWVQESERQHCGWRCHRSRDNASC